MTDFNPRRLAHVESSGQAVGGSGRALWRAPARFADRHGLDFRDALGRSAEPTRARPPLLAWGANAVGLRVLRRLGRSGPHVALATALWLLSGCVQGGVPPLASGHAPVASPSEPPVADALPAAPRDRSGASMALADEDLLVALLAGEIAVAQGDFAAAAFWLGEAAQRTDDAEVAERATRVALFARDDARAVAAANRWLALAPDNYEAVQISALLSLRAGRIDDAVEALVRVLDRFEARGDAEAGPRMVGVLLDQAEDGEAARAALEALIDRRPDQRLLWQLRVERSLRDDDAATARAVANRAAERFPGVLRFALLRVQAYEDQPEAGEWLVQARQDAAMRAAASDEERLALDLALASWWGERLAPPSADGSSADAVAAEGPTVDPDRAEAVLSEWAQSEGVPARALITAGVAALEAERWALAEQLFDALMKQPEAADDARFLLGRLAELRGEDALAIERYDAVGEGRFRQEAALRAARLMVRDRERREAGFERLRDLQEADDDEAAMSAYQVAAQVARELRLAEPALDMLRRGLLRFPGSPELLYARGLLYERLDDIEAAERDFRAILDQDPDHVGALNALGYTLADRTDRYEEAYGYIVRALEQAPDDAAIIDSYGWVLYRLGRLEEAREQLERAYSMFDDGEIASNYATVLWTLGERERAREIVERALDRHPDHERLIRTRDRIAQ